MAFKEVNKELENNVGLAFLPINHWVNFDLNKRQDWIKELLIELNERAVDKSVEDYLLETELDINMNIMRKNQSAFGDYVLAKGKIKTVYATECVKTGMPMKEPLTVEFRACYLDKTFEGTDEYKEATDIFIENEMYELFFYDKRKLDLKEMIHEFIFLYMNQYPCLEATADGMLTDPNNTRQ